MEYFDFAGHSLSRVFKGNWQLAGGHGEVDRQQAIKDLFAYAEAGVNVFDVGDIYTGVEEIVGDFLVEYRQKYGDEMADKLRVHTKFVPDLDKLSNLTKADVEYVIKRSLKRLKLDKLHLVQFHWWDFAMGDYVQAARYLQDLQSEGLIESIGLTNFDVQHTQALLESGISIASNQIQFSLIDPRPLNGMLEFAKSNNIHLFCYGVLSGGLLAGKPLDAEPDNRSVIKYRLMIDEIGDDQYRAITDRLTSLAAKYQTTSATIAASYILHTDGVSSVIFGPRNTAHIAELADLKSVQLTDDEYASLRTISAQEQQRISSDIYSFERISGGSHAGIMKYNLNEDKSDE